MILEMITIRVTPGMPPLPVVFFALASKYAYSLNSKGTV